MAADRSIAAESLSSQEEPRRWRRKLIIGLLGIFGLAALQSLLLVPGVITQGAFCRSLFGIPLYLVYLPLGSALVCLIALRLQLRFGLIWLFALFLTSAYRHAEDYEFLMSSALSRITVYFREAIARSADIVTGAACNIPFEPVQVWAALAYGCLPDSRGGNEARRRGVNRRAVMIALESGCWCRAKTIARGLVGAGTIAGCDTASAPAP